MTSSRASYHHGDLKTALIECAKQLLNDGGLKALSLRALAAAAGVSHMAPYAHFKNRTELFQAIAASGFRQLTTELECVNGRLPASQLILAYGVAYINFALNNAPLYRLMLSQTQAMQSAQANDSTGHLSDELAACSARPFMLLRQGFARVIRSDREQIIKAQGAWSMVHGMAALMIDGHLKVPEDMTLTQYLEVAAPTLHAGNS